MLAGMDHNEYRHQLKQEQTRYWQNKLPGSKVTCADTADGGFTITTDPGHRPQPSITLTYGPMPPPEGSYQAIERMRQLREDLESLGFQLE